MSEKKTPEQAAEEYGKANEPSWFDTRKDGWVLPSAFLAGRQHFIERELRDIIVAAYMEGTLEAPARRDVGEYAAEMAQALLTARRPS